MPVYNRFCRLSCHQPGDTGEITRRDTKLVRIISDLFLLGIMGMDTIDEFIEDLLHPAGAVSLKSGKGMSGLIIYIQEETL